MSAVKPGIAQEECRPASKHCNCGASTVSCTDATTHLSLNNNGHDNNLVQELDDTWGGWGGCRREEEGCSDGTLDARISPCTPGGAPNDGGPCPCGHGPRPCTCAQGPEKSTLSSSEHCNCEPSTTTCTDRAPHLSSRQRARQTPWPRTARNSAFSVLSQTVSSVVAQTGCLLSDRETCRCINGQRTTCCICKTGTSTTMYKATEEPHRHDGEIDDLEDELQRSTSRRCAAPSGPWHLS